MSKLIILLVTILSIPGQHLIFADEFDYYWREYQGVIPPDAIVAGQDANGQNVYIGQGYLKNAGLIPGKIQASVKEILVPYYGVKKIDNFIKILCGPSDIFYWLPVTSANFHELIFDKYAVIGGHERGTGETNVGRVKRGEKTILGKILSWTETPCLDWANIDNNTEDCLTSYEVLLYT